jgi:hypothetical protein
MSHAPVGSGNADKSAISEPQCTLFVLTNKWINRHLNQLMILTLVLGTFLIIHRLDCGATLHLTSNVTSLKSKPTTVDPAQYRRFRDLAAELGVEDGNEKAVEQAVKRLAKQGRAEAHQATEGS